MAWSSRLRLLAAFAGLLLICAALGALIVGQLRGGERAATGPASPPAAAESASPAMPRFDLPPLEAYAELLERPLFSSTRRPVETDGEVAQVAVTSQGLDVGLTGVIVGDDSKVAIIMPRNAAKPVRLNEGQRFEGWILSEVDPEGVIFRQGTRAQILELNHKAGSAVAEN